MAVNFLISPKLSPINFQALDTVDSVRYHTKWMGDDFFSNSIQKWQQQRTANGKKIDYAQKWQRTDRLTPQIAVPFNRKINVYLYNCAGKQIITIDNYLTASYEGDFSNGIPLQRHQFNFSLAQLDVVNGRYFIVIDVSNENFDSPDFTYKSYISDPLQFRDQWPYTLLAECSNQRSEYNIRFDMIRRFHLRVEGFLRPLPTTFQDNDLEDQQSNGIKLFSGASYPHEVTFGSKTNLQQALPPIMLQKVSEFLRCNKLLIDGRPFYRPANSGLETSDLGANYPLYNATITLNAQDAQNNDERGVKRITLTLPSTYPFFTTGITLNDGGFPFTIVPISVIEDASARAAIVGAANNLGLDGLFSIDGNDLVYEYSVEQGLSLEGRFFTKSFTLQTTYNGSTLPNNRFTIELQGLSSVGMAWGDGSFSELTLNPNNYQTYQKQYLAGATNNKTIRVFHRDDVLKVRVINSSNRNQVSSFAGTLPYQLKNFHVSNQVIPIVNGNFFDSAKVPFLEMLQLSNNLTSTIGNIDWDNSNGSAVYLSFNLNQLSSANVDELFNDFWGPGAYGYGGGFYIDGQTPAAPPTSASSVARQGLLDYGWSIETD